MLLNAQKGNDGPIHIQPPENLTICDLDEASPAGSALLALYK